MSQSDYTEFGHHRDELQLVTVGWFQDILHPYTEESLAMPNKGWAVEPWDDLTIPIYGAALHSTEGTGLTQTANFSNPRYRDVYALCLRRRLDGKPLDGELHSLRKVEPDLRRYLQALLEGKIEGFETAEEQRERVEKETARWFMGWGGGKR